MKIALARHCVLGKLLRHPVINSLQPKPVCSATYVKVYIEHHRSLPLAKIRPTVGSCISSISVALVAHAKDALQIRFPDHNLEWQHRKQKSGNPHQYFKDNC